MRILAIIDWYTHNNQLLIILCIVMLLYRCSTPIEDTNTVTTPSSSMEELSISLNYTEEHRRIITQATPDNSTLPCSSIV